MHGAAIWLIGVKVAAEIGTADITGNWISMANVDEKSYSLQLDTWNGL